ncbi:hypothetical protein AcW1_004168 [Taiwanofungus camphoratus]|nr:hypothetical protein AcW2_006819 [Antrodia cinnamomea]KAI0939019.1 hypothetical protein AcV5_000549 [Antrodia cinnamomea]KAI0959309.1 hypothetical protein AcW1_004168 [Antrodia cinnamomea]
MSISVDDLVASLSSNHIGQEAMDLATLHTQLAQALFTQSTSVSPSVSRRGYAPSNTPTARTPSSSFCWEPTEFSRGRSSSVASMTSKRASDDRKRDSDDMDEDERMVEDILFSSPPVSASATTSHFPLSHQQMPSASPSSSYSGMLSRRPSMSTVASSYDHSQYELPSPNTSLFASTDPFFVAQSQAAQNPTPSLFAQAGRPSPHSPFLTHQYQSSYGHAHNHHSMSPEADPHNLKFAATPAAFTC